jgi:hypothetical protein
MGFLSKLLGRDDKKNKGTLTMSGPSPRRQRQVSPGTIDIAAGRVTNANLPMVLNSIGAPREIPSFERPMEMMKKGGSVKKMAKGGQTGYRKAADGCATKGKTRGKMV